MSALALVAAALCSGAAAVLQASAVGRSSAERVAGFLGGLARDPRYLVGTALVGVSFLASLVAVRALPLFLVQAGRASSLGVTAVLAAVLLGSRLRAREVVALVALAGGLVGVAVAAQPSVAEQVPTWVSWCALAAAGLSAVAVAVGTRLGASGAALGVLAGVAFGVLSLAARVLAPVTVPGVLGDPAAWAVGVAGLTGLVAGALALQRGAVVVVTATMVASESVLGAGLGLAVGDQTVPGLGWLAVLGFVVTVGAAICLARFGVPTVPADELLDEHHRQ
ncbi:hypothetical protein [Klenkia marina]|uniref:hypothetical protein n=1 Tax=Klenkia marina TaxID=1960309 RepID=UPI001059B3D9|nr:hypothetical protein [Klenkia marina]